MSQLVTVKTFTTRIEAEIAKGLLEANNIKAIIIADDAGGMRPFPFSYVPGVDLIVLEEDLVKATELLTHSSQ